MSEPIQSISQGNYILATQQEVSHDNTLSGNGTVDSPLGVVPGYNETVLWSGTQYLSAVGDTITLNEPYSAFDKLGIYVGGFQNDYQPQYNQFLLLPNEGQIFMVTAQNVPGSTSGIRFSYAEMSGNKNDTLKINKSWQFSLTGTAVTNGKSYSYIRQVVGINRIGG